MPHQNIGIIGVGTIGQEHARVAQALGAQIVSACANSQSSNWESFRKISPNANFHANPFELIDDPEVTAIVVCPSWEVIPTWLSRLLNHPKPMLIEKPIGLHKQELQESLKGRPKHFHKAIGFNRRFYEPVRRLSERMERGGLISVEVTISESVSRLREKYGSKIVPLLLPYSSSHLLDLILHLLGPLNVIHSYAREETDDLKPFVGYSALLETSKRCPVWLTIHAEDPTPIGVKCRFDDHTVWDLKPIERLTVQKGIEAEEPNKHRNIRRYLPEIVETVNVAQSDNFKPGFYEQMKDFLGGNDTIAASADDSLAVLDLIESVKSSAIKSLSTDKGGK